MRTRRERLSLYVPVRESGHCLRASNDDAKKKKEKNRPTSMEQVNETRKSDNQETAERFVQGSYHIMGALWFKE